MGPQLYGREPEAIRLRVEAVNRANDLANRCYKAMVPYFTPLVGKKVINADLHLTKAVEAKLPPVPGKGEPGVHVYYHSSPYSVSWQYRVTAWNAMEQNMTAEAWVNLGNLDGDKLRDIATFEQQGDRRTDYDFETVMKWREAAKAAREVFDDAQSACHPFEDDSLRR